MAVVQGIEAYEAAKVADDPETRRGLLQDAAKHWEVALRFYGPTTQDAARLRSNLATAHLKLMMLAAEASEPELASYHVKQVAGHVEQRAKILDDAGTWDKFTTKFLLELAQASLPFERVLGLLRAFQQPRLPPSAEGRVATYTAAKLVKKAVLVTNNCGYDELAHVFRFTGAASTELPEGLRAWTTAKQHIIEAARFLDRASQLGEPGEPTDAPPGVEAGDEADSAASADADGVQLERDESLKGLADQARFLLHRGEAMLHLFQASRQLSEALVGAEALNMDRCMDALDAHIQALQVSQRNSDAPPILGNSMDIEMTSISLSHLAHVYDVLGLKKQAGMRYTECIRVATSMDATTPPSIDVILEGCRLPKTPLYSKGWFQKAAAFLRARQAAAVDEAEKARQERVEIIRTEVEQMHQAHSQGMVPLGNYLIRTYPRKEALDYLKEPVAKNTFMRLLVAYNPDKQQAVPPGWCHSLDSWKDFCTEAAKALNFHYEAEYKSR